MYCQIDGEDFVNFCCLLRKHELKNLHFFICILNTYMIYYVEYIGQFSKFMGEKSRFSHVNVSDLVYYFIFLYYYTVIWRVFFCFFEFDWNKESRSTRLRYFTSTKYTHLAVYCIIWPIWITFKNYSTVIWRIFKIVWISTC